MKRTLLLLAFLLVYGCEKKTCDVIGPKEFAFYKAGPTKDGYILPNGMQITPFGQELKIENFPMNMVEVPEKNVLISTNNGTESQSLQVIDLKEYKIKQTIKKEGGYNFFIGLLVNNEGTKLFASGGGSDRVWIYKINEDGSLSEEEFIKVEGFPGALELINGSTLLVAQHLWDRIAVIDLATRKIIHEIEVGDKTDTNPAAYPFWIVKSKDEKKVYVSNWGEKSVSVISMEDFVEKKRIPVGKNPEGMVISNDGKTLYVANSDTDDITIIDTEKDEVIGSISVKLSENSSIGATPSSIDMSSDGSLLFVSSSGLNSIDIISVSEKRVIGRIPTGWYPTRVLLSSDGEKLYVLSAKGYGSGPNLEGRYVGVLNLGLLTIVSLSDAMRKIETLTNQVVENNTRHLKFYETPCENINSPVPAKPKRPSPSPIKHVILIIRENKTYDQYLGDLEGTEADKNLVQFGEDYTPNTHKLAREFVNFDNCYADSEVSVQGHMWLTASISNDYVERAWLGAEGGRIFLPGIEPAGYPANDFFFHHLYRHGIKFLVYGEAVGTLSDFYGLFGREKIFKDYVDGNWPGGPIWNMGVKDEVRARYFLKKLEELLRRTFILMLLPNDHTYGISPGKPAPESMVSDNDYALGLVIEGLSHSRFWKDTAVFVVEDDPQSGADHIDAHRTVCLLISPYAKRGYVSHVHYSFPSIYKTIELILGVPPIYHYDENAPPMYDAFTNEPDFTPYEALERRIPDRIIPKYEELSAEMKRLARLSMKMDFSEPDSIKNHHMGYVLREYFRLKRMEEAK